MSSEANDERAPTVPTPISNRPGDHVVSLTDHFWEPFEGMVLDLQRSLRIHDVLTVAANHGRVLLDCDRLSIAIKRAGRYQVMAISGQDLVQGRSPEVIALQELANQAAGLQEPLCYSGAIQSYPPEVEQALVEYLTESHTRMLWLLPLQEADKAVPSASPQSVETRQLPREPFGCLIVEQMREGHLSNEMKARAEVLVDHVAAAIHKALQIESIMFLAMWQAIGRASHRLKGRIYLAMSAAILVAGVIGVLALIPWEYRVACNGKLFPVQRADVFVPWDGDVVDVLVEDGQRVAVGQPLVRLKSDDLNTEMLTVVTALDEYQKRLKALESQLNEAERRDNRSDSIRLQGEVKQVEIEIAGTEEKRQVLGQRLDKLLIRASQAGVVATFQIKQLLLNRPVQRGERLLQVMDTTGHWQLELEVPEYRSGHVLEALQGSPTKTLPVDYVLATDVEQTRIGTLSIAATRADESERLGSIVEMIVATDAARLEDSRVGAEVSAKIRCGRRSLGFVLFGDVLEFFQRHLWF